MRLAIEAKNFSLTPDVREYVTKKIGGLSKFAGQRAYDKVTQVDLTRDRHHRRGEVFSATVNFAIKNDLLYAQGSGQNVFAAIDEVESALKYELRRRHDKKRTLLMRRLRYWKEATRSFWRRSKGP